MPNNLLTAALGDAESVALNRWAARLLHQAALAIGAVLDSTADLPEQARADLRDALSATVWWQLELATKGGRR